MDWQRALVVLERVCDRPVVRKAPSKKRRVPSEAKAAWRADKPKRKGKETILEPAKIVGPRTAVIGRLALLKTINRLPLANLGQLRLLGELARLQHAGPGDTRPAPISATSVGGLAPVLAPVSAAFAHGAAPGSAAAVDNDHLAWLLQPLLSLGNLGHLSTLASLSDFGHLGDLSPLRKLQRLGDMRHLALPAPLIVVPVSVLVKQLLLLKNLVFLRHLKELAPLAEAVLPGTTAQFRHLASFAELSELSDLSSVTSSEVACPDSIASISSASSASCASFATCACACYPTPICCRPTPTCRRPAPIWRCPTMRPTLRQAPKDSTLRLPSAVS